MVDADGFRPNVGIVIAAGDGSGRVLWARRVGGHDAWQFPQGGIHEGESPDEALFRELYEEVGLTEHDVTILGRSRGWLRYRLPRRLRRNNSTPGFVGQKQKWFLLRLDCDPGRISFDKDDKPEFDGWRWVSYWYPITKVVDFKREVYRRALVDLAGYLPLDEALRVPGGGPGGITSNRAWGTRNGSASPGQSRSAKRRRRRKNNAQRRGR